MKERGNGKLQKTSRVAVNKRIFINKKNNNNFDNNLTHARNGNR